MKRTSFIAVIMAAFFSLTMIAGNMNADETKENTGCDCAKCEQAQCCADNSQCSDGTCSCEACTCCKTASADASAEKVCAKTASADDASMKSCCKTAAKAKCPMKSSGGHAAMHSGLQTSTAAVTTVAENCPESCCKDGACTKNADGTCKCKDGKTAMKMSASQKSSCKTDGQTLGINQ